MTFTPQSWCIGFQLLYKASYLGGRLLTHLGWLGVSSSLELHNFYNSLEGCASSRGQSSTTYLEGGANSRGDPEFNTYLEYLELKG